MRFRQFDKLRSFSLVARHDSFSRAAEAMNLTKGAISHQIDRLEQELGFELFLRGKQGIELTRSGRRLLQVAQLAFTSIEQGIEDLRRQESNSLVIGMATYFASRWLSPRLMHFISAHGDIRLRIQPLVDPGELNANDLDMAIRWGRGEWHDPGMRIEPIFAAPATLTAGVETGRRIDTEGLAAAVPKLNLLHDADGSRAWAEWFSAAGLEIRPGGEELVIPDPNVRLQAVANEQGIGLYDRLIDDEVDAGRLYRHAGIALEHYGYYLVYPESAAVDSAVRVFRDWILREAAENGTA